MGSKMKLLFFIGKGGVGKSTVSAITSVKLSLLKKRTLLLSIDPAHNLMDIFKIKDVNDYLTIKEAEIDKWTSRYIKKIKMDIKCQYKHLSSINIEHFIDIIEYSPGMEEYSIFRYLYETVKLSKNYDYIVVDTPPTGITLKIITFAEISVRWIKKLMEIREKILSKKVYIKNAIGKKDEYGYNKEEDKIYLKLREMLEDNIMMLDLIRDNSFIIPVLNEDKLSFLETKKIIEYLNKFSINIDFLILNKFTGNRELLDNFYREFKKDIFCFDLKELDFYLNINNFKYLSDEYIKKYLIQ
ncbi:MAG: TRC40/GET3/ArsA family transport-energizing ATPase [Desulfonauticus sp.]|nr:TRC40/GET3/ArsA family transport-energizing ATPase [Desulfonauticus sp.]